MKCDAVMTAMLALILAGCTAHAATAGARPADDAPGASEVVATGSIQVDSKAARKISAASLAIAFAISSSIPLPLAAVACCGVPYQPVGAMHRISVSTGW